MTVDARSQHQILEQIQQLSPDTQYSIIQALVKQLTQNNKSTLIWSTARQLTSDEQFKLIQDLLNLYQYEVKMERHADRSRNNGPKHDITELEGLGAEIWEGIDAQEYVNEERRSWGG